MYDIHVHSTHVQTCGIVLMVRNSPYDIFNLSLSYMYIYTLLVQEDSKIWYLQRLMVKYLFENGADVISESKFPMEACPTPS